MFAAALLNWCDDHGYFRSHPALIAGALLPYDNDGKEFSTRALAELEAVGFVALFEGSIGQVVNFGSHQVINKPSTSRLAEKAKVRIQVLPEDSRSPTVVLPEDSHTEMEVEQGSGSGTGSREVESTPPPKIREVVPFVVTKPTTSPEAWTGEDFWRWAQFKRQEAGFVAETRRPRDLGGWYSTVLMTLQGDVQRLQEAFYRFGEDKHWQAAKPALPFGAFVAQWGDYVPRKAANV